MRSRRVLVMTRRDLVPPETLEGLTPQEIERIKTDYDVVFELRELGHEVEVVGLEGELEPLTEALARFRPHVVFNLLEEFARSQAKMAYCLGYLELVGQAYTGCNPAGMLFSTSKSLQRRLLRRARVRTPEYAIFRLGRAVKRPGRLQFPLIVKSATAHGSVGISRASIVEDDESLAERVGFVHERIGTDAIAESYIEGREVYVSILGNHRLRVMPVMEMRFKNLAEGAPRIATEKVKRSPTYQKATGLDIVEARLDEEVERRLISQCKRAYRALGQTGYARMDVRVREDGRAYLIESNPNPQLSQDDEFALATRAAGMSYAEVIGRIVSLGVRWAREPREG
ncbi:MAG: ATP-grasp domain-containing protein [Phycisphaerales bacterium]